MTIKYLDLYSEPFGATGNIGDSFCRLLGAPSLDPLQTVIREAVQNIADAAKLGVGPEIQIRLRRLTAAQHDVLASKVVHKLPPRDLLNDRLYNISSSPEIVVMEICDFGTIGLGGPVRSDRIKVGEERTDFIDFLRNIGIARDTELGGGTYGFGKAALFRASRCNTVIVDTLPHGMGPKERRLIGSHVGSSFAVQKNGMYHRYTGRHWWGVADAVDKVSDPITGDDAAALARELGFPKRSANRSGTSIMILDFETDGEPLDVIAYRIAETLLWNFWPRMMRDTPTDQRFKCRVEVDGSPISIPYPEDFPPLDLFSKAMKAIRRGAGNDVRTISSRKPAQELGTLAIEQGLRTPRRPLVENNSLIPSSARHIALMRPVELVVKYIEGRPFPDDHVEWAGVFVVDRDKEVERAFAESEPPAHDDWIPNYLQNRRKKIFVNRALIQLREAASNMGEEATDLPSDTETGPPLARLAGRLGAALEGTRGDGAGKRPSPGRPGGRRPARARSTTPRFERLELGQSGPVAVFSTIVHQDASRSGSFLAARAAVAIEGLSTSQIDDNIQQPDILSIRSTEGHHSVRGDRLALAGSEGEFEIRVLVPADSAAIVKTEVIHET